MSENIARSRVSGGRVPKRHARVSGRAHSHPNCRSLPLPLPPSPLPPSPTGGNLRLPSPHGTVQRLRVCSCAVVTSRFLDGNAPVNILCARASICHGVSSPSSTITAPFHSHRLLPRVSYTPLPTPLLLHLGHRPLSTPKNFLSPPSHGDSRSRHPLCATLTAVVVPVSSGRDLQLREIIIPMSCDLPFSSYFLPFCLIPFDPFVAPVKRFIKTQEQPSIIKKLYAWRNNRQRKRRTETHL